MLKQHKEHLSVVREVHPELGPPYLKLKQRCDSTVDALRAMLLSMADQLDQHAVDRLNEDGADHVIAAIMLQLRGSSSQTLQKVHYAKVWEMPQDARTPEGTLELQVPERTVEALRMSLRQAYDSLEFPEQVWKAQFFDRTRAEVIVDGLHEVLESKDRKNLSGNHYFVYEEDHRRDRRRKGRNHGVITNYFEHEGDVIAVHEHDYVHYLEEIRDQERAEEKRRARKKSA